MRRGVMVVVLCLFLGMSVWADVGDFPQVTASLLSQSPDPVEPGQTVKIRVQIENTGKETTQDTTVRVVAEHPFSVYNGIATQNIGKLQASTSAADAKIVEYTLKVTEDAVEAETPLKIELLVDGQGRIYEFDIDIETHDAVLEVTDIQLKPNQLAPGGTVEVAVSLRNLADSLLKDIRYKLDFSSPDLPLAPYQSSSERSLAQLKTGYTDTVRFTLIADPDATPGLYKVPLNLTYSDEKGTKRQVQDVLAITVGDTPQVVPHIKASTVRQAGQAGLVTLEIANAGTTGMKLLELHVVADDSYQLITPSNYFYIGDIDADDTESEEISLYVHEGVEKLQIPVKLKYFDANNKQFSQQFVLQMDLYSTSDLRKFGLVESNSFVVYVLILLVLAGGGWYWWKKRKK